jgi:hypothetical protein
VALLTLQAPQQGGVGLLVLFAFDYSPVISSLINKPAMQSKTIGARAKSKAVIR